MWYFQNNSFDTCTTTAGTYIIECMNSEHLVDGMTALYTVSNCDATDEPTNTVVERKYFIGATEMDWDYAPIKWDFIRNISLLDEER